MYLSFYLFLRERNAHKSFYKYKNPWEYSEDPNIAISTRRTLSDVKKEILQRYTTRVSSILETFQTNHNTYCSLCLRQKSIL